MLIIIVRESGSSLHGTPAARGACGVSGSRKSKLCAVTAFAMWNEAHVPRRNERAQKNTKAKSMAASVRTRVAQQMTNGTPEAWTSLARSSVSHALKKAIVNGPPRDGECAPSVCAITDGATRTRRPHASVKAMVRCWPRHGTSPSPAKCRMDGAKRQRHWRNWLMQPWYLMIVGMKEEMPRAARQQQMGA